jgi:hypothetical protein
MAPYPVITFIVASAPSQEVPESFSPYLVPIASAGNAIGRIVTGLLADYFGNSLSLPPFSLPWHRSRPAEHHDTCIAHCGRADNHMAVYTWDSRTRHDRCDLWRVVQRDGGPYRRTDDGAWQPRRCRTPHGHVLHNRLIWRTRRPADIWRDQPPHRRVHRSRDLCRCVVVTMLVKVGLTTFRFLGDRWGLSTGTLPIFCAGKMERQSVVESESGYS